FLQLVSPQISVISVGAGNRYGHQHAEVLALLTKLKSAVLRTDQLGTIILASDGQTVKSVK
ncbi:MAG: MBL fold metallo-hydrolase, partial [Candidatus Vogelbacteria bacterium]|nr:MBL fold metallo-hydrolase [Candidatus Vogelbacteria bacterium]